MPQPGSKKTKSPTQQPSEAHDAQAPRDALKGAVRRTEGYDQQRALLSPGAGMNKAGFSTSLRDMSQYGRARCGVTDFYRMRNDQKRIHRSVDSVGKNVHVERRRYRDNKVAYPTGAEHLRHPVIALNANKDPLTTQLTYGHEYDHAVHMASEGICEQMAQCADAASDYTDRDFSWDTREKAMANGDMEISMDALSDCIDASPDRASNHERIYQREALMSLAMHRAHANDAASPDAARDNLTLAMNRAITGDSKDPRRLASMVPTPEERALQQERHRRDGMGMLRAAYRAEPELIAAMLREGKTKNDALYQAYCAPDPTECEQYTEHTADLRGEDSGYCVAEDGHLGMKIPRLDVHRDDELLTTGSLDYATMPDSEFECRSLVEHLNHGTSSDSGPEKSSRKSVVALQAEQLDAYRKDDNPTERDITRQDWAEKTLVQPRLQTAHEAELKEVGSGETDACMGPTFDNVSQATIQRLAVLQQSFAGSQLTISASPHKRGKASRRRAQEAAERAKSAFIDAGVDAASIEIIVMNTAGEGAPVEVMLHQL